MKEEKMIVPANCYLMLFLFIILFFGSIATIITLKTPWPGITIFLSIIMAFGFVMVQTN